MTYQKPICDCGEELVFHCIESGDVEYKIKKDGTLVKKGKSIGIRQQDNWGCLFCPKCLNTYEYNYAFRGEEAFKFKREEKL